MAGTPVELLVSYRPSGDEMSPYERLLGDAMRGDPALFAREDSVEEAWRIVDPITDCTKPTPVYEPGTWGPPEADDLPARGWHNPTVRHPEAEAAAAATSA
jgi:glucose-6-phosphate 1-dehydrogenase